jgi:hypothetical protein
MKKRLVSAVVSILFLTAFALPAHAFHCPADVKAIDHALPKSNLSAQQKAEVEKLRNEGEALHNAGKHKDSVGKLAEAMRILLNNM